jgi:hypothetical protein
MPKKTAVRLLTTARARRLVTVAARRGTTK